MIVDLLVIALVLATFRLLFSNRHDFESASVFTVMTLFHLVLDYMIGFNGWVYYYSAALTDLIIISLLNHVSSTKTTDLLQKLGLIFLFINFFGWVIWFVYLPPIAYNLASYMAYVTALLVILRQDIKHGLNKLHDWCSSIRDHDCTRNKRHKQKEVEA